MFGLSEDGLAAAGWITLAATLTRYADRADQIVATTIYPAIVRVRDRVDVLEELFAKSNRLTLMWAFPFGAGLVLFGPDLIALRARRRVGAGGRAAGRPGGRHRAPAAGLQLVRVLPGARRVAAAGRRVGRVRRARSPRSRCRARWLWGSWGFVAGRIACTGCVLAVRRVYVRRLLPGRAPVRARRSAAAVPVLAASAPVVALRLALWGGERPLVAGAGGARAVAGGLALATRRLRAGLLRELWGYLRPGGRLARRLVRRAPARRAALLWLAAALISGFTMRRYLEPFDEGLLLQAATRMADGQWPYRDFGWAYGPGQPRS